MQQFSRRVALCSILAFALSWVCAAAQEAQSLAPIQLTFPLKATVPNQDQHLTPSTAPANSVFDHSMLDAATHYVIYGCDKTAVAFNGTTAPFGPGYPILGIGCNAGYKVQNVQNPPPISFAPDMSYAGWGLPGYLFYDGHPGIDFVAAMYTQAYAAVNGTVHYPTRMVGLGYPAAAYHTLELVPEHAPVLPPPYVIYYLHLDTYVGQNKMPAYYPDPLPGCSATVYLPHLHFEVQEVVPNGLVFSRFGARTADVCIDGVVGSAYDCVPVDPYGWKGAQTVCDPVTGLADSGDPYYCLTGVPSVGLWK